MRSRLQWGRIHIIDNWVNRGFHDFPYSSRNETELKVSRRKSVRSRATETVLNRSTGRRLPRLVRDTAGVRWCDGMNAVPEAGAPIRDGIGLNNDAVPQGRRSGQCAWSNSRSWRSSL